MSAYRSFFVAAEAGRFSIQESGDLWALLARITLRKLYRTVAHHTADKRSVDAEEELPADADHSHWATDAQPTPEEAVALSDALESLLSSLTPQARRVLELRLQGEQFADIAAAIGISERTVRRTMTDIRQRLERRLHEDSGNVAQAADPATNDKDGLASSAAESDDTTSTRKRTIPARPESDCPARESAPLDNNVDIPFDGIVLQKMIGSGGMGKVYRAEYRQTGKAIAVKFLHKSLQESPSIVRRFLEEAAIVRRLSHDGIVGLHGVGRTAAGVYFIVMRLVDGKSLDKHQLPLDPAVAVRWVAEIADSLQHAHDAGIVHCDVKPANVMITESDHPVLTDFGLAHVFTDSQKQPRVLAGTAPWMAPEQVDEYFGPVSVRTDVYGLGALMYTLISGHPPFVGERTADVLSKVVSAGKPATLSESVAAAPTAVSDLCARCLAKDPDERPNSAAEVARLLRLC